MPRTRFFPVAYKSIRVYFRRAASKITPHGIFIFYANLNLNDAQVKSAPERLACFSTPFFSNRYSRFRSTILFTRLYFTIRKKRRKKRYFVAFLYKIPLRNGGSYVQFLSRRRQRTGSSFHYETYLVRVNPLNTISENYVHQYLT